MKSRSITEKMTGRFVFILLLCVSTPLFASYDGALGLFQKKNYTEALKILGQELIPANDLGANSPNYRIRYLAAHCHWKLGNIQSASAHFLRCMDINKDAVEPYVDLAFCNYDFKKYTDAETFATRGLKLKQNALLYYILGKISLARKNYWRAKSLFEKTNSCDPELYMSYNSLGMSLMNLKKFSEANTAFSVANALKPDLPEILNNLGVSFQRLGDISKAVELYENASKISKDNKIIADNIRIAKKVAADRQNRP